jgi:VanZ family protein
MRSLAHAWTVLVLALLWMPTSGAPSGGPGLDLLAHVVLFLVFALLWQKAVRHQKTAKVLVFGLLLALLTELIQETLPWPRTLEPLDLAADVVGLVLGVLAARLRWRNGRDSNPR